MILFDYHKVKGLNNSELSVYNFILQQRAIDIYKSIDNNHHSFCEKDGI